MLLGAACPPPALAGATGGVRVCILLSRLLPPYMEVANGVAVDLKTLRNISATKISLSRYSQKERGGLSAKIRKENYDLIVAIGPEAARFAWSPEGFPRVPKLFAMVRNPAAAGGESPGCGIFLDIPVPEQLQAIRQAYPGTRRMGLLFDPARNQAAFEAAAGISSELDMTLVPLAVSAARDIQNTLKESWDRMDALWVLPDRKTLMSKRLAEYVIRQALFRKVPVIGYDRPFYDSGASLAFVVDYRKVAAQCARKAIGILDGGPCGKESPAFEVWVNARVMTRMGVPVPRPMAPPLRQGP